MCRTSSLSNGSSLFLPRMECGGRYDCVHLKGSKGIPEKELMYNYHTYIPRSSVRLYELLMHRHIRYVDALALFPGCPPQVFIIALSLRTGQKVNLDKLTLIYLTWKSSLAWGGSWESALVLYMTVRGAGCFREKNDSRRSTTSARVSPRMVLSPI